MWRYIEVNFQDRGHLFPNLLLNLRNIIVGLYLFIFGFLPVVFLYPLVIAPFFILIPIKPRAFLNIVEKIHGYSIHYYCALIEFTNTKISISGDAIRQDEWALILPNHRSTWDWLFVNCYLYKFISLPRVKNIMIHWAKSFPGIGWASSMSAYLFLREPFKDYQIAFDQSLDYVTSKQSSFYKLVLFPEGSRLIPYWKDKSDRFADKFGLPKYDYVLHPRSTGLNHVVRKMKAKGCLDAIYDVTLSFPRGNIPVYEQDLFLGALPPLVHIHVDRYAIGDVPDTADGIKNWCSELWLKKEVNLAGLYSGKLALGDSAMGVLEPVINRMVKLTVSVGMVVIGVMLYIVLNYAIAWYYMWVVLILCITVDLWFEGFHRLQVNRWFMMR